MELFTEAWKEKEKEKEKEKAHQEQDVIPVGVLQGSFKVADLIESEEKEPIQIGKRVLGEEGPQPPWVKRQKGCDNLRRPPWYGLK